MDHLAVGADDRHVQAFDGQAIARFGYDLFCLCIGNNLLESRIAALGSLVEFAVRAVDEKGANGNALYKLRHPTHVVIVIVSDQHIVDAAQASALRGGDDAIGIAEIVAGPTGVDQQRFPCRRDEQRGLAPLDVDEINAEFAGCRGTLRLQREYTCKYGNESDERAGTKHHEWPPLVGFETVARIAPVEMPPSTSSVWPVM